VIRRMALLHDLRECFGIGGGRVLQLVDKCLDDVLVLVLLFLLPHFRIRADGEGTERDGAFLCPLRECLGKQIQRWDEEEHALVFPGDFLGDFHGGKSFPSATGHDELATIRAFEPGADGGSGGLLVGEEFFLFPERDFFRGSVFRPVDLAVFQVLQGDLDRGRVLPL